MELSDKEYRRLKAIERYWNLLTEEFIEKYPEWYDGVGVARFEMYIPLTHQDETLEEAIDRMVK